MRRQTTSIKHRARRGPLNAAARHDGPGRTTRDAPLKRRCLRPPIFGRRSRSGASPGRVGVRGGHAGRATLTSARPWRRPSRAVALIFSASSLADAFLDGLRRALDEILGLLQAEARDGADLLDDLDLLVADGGEDDRELGLLLDRAAAAAAPGAAATATAAAAETPHFSSRSFASSAASRTVSDDRSSTILARSAMSCILRVRFERLMG